MNQSQKEKQKLEKQKLEKQAAKLFAHCYSDTLNRDIHFVSHNAPQKPDVTCTLDNKPIDIEIAHLYGSQAEAQKILGKSLDVKTRQELQQLDAEGDTDERLVKSLNRILLNKATKRYDSQKVWLVIRNANPLWSRQNVLSHLKNIVVPAKHPFQQIWLIADMLGKTGLIRLL